MFLRNSGTLNRSEEPKILTGDTKYAELAVRRTLAEYSRGTDVWDR